MASGASFCTEAMPFFALAFVSYASPTAMISPFPALSRNRNLPFASLYSARTCPPCCYSLSVTTPPAE